MSGALMISYRLKINRDKSTNKINIYRNKSKIPHIKNKTLYCAKQQQQNCDTIFIFWIQHTDVIYIFLRIHSNSMHNKSTFFFIRISDQTIQKNFFN